MGVFLPHIQRLRRGGQPFALTNGIERQPLVPAQNFAAAVGDGPGLDSLGRVLRQEGTIIPLSQKAQVLALGLVCRWQAALLSDAAHIAFAQLPQREKCMSQLLLGKHAEEIGLVFTGVLAFPKLKQALMSGKDARVVPGGEVVRTDGFRVVPQRAPLEVAVAGDAGVGRLAAGVAFEELAHDDFPEVFSFIQHDKGDVELIRQSGCQGARFRRAAAVFLLAARDAPQAHCGADNLEALFHQQRRGD